VLRFALRPRWLAWHLALVVALATFGWLGWWQVGSFGEEAERPSDQPVTSLDRVTEPGGRLDRADVGRRVTAEGSWLPEAQLLAPGRERDGREGAWVITPLQTSAGVMPVVRGWVPNGEPVPEPPAGPVSVIGVVQPSEDQRDATRPAGALPDAAVPYVATVTLLSADGAAGRAYEPSTVYDGFVVLREATPADDGLTRVEPEHSAAPEAVGRWRNLGYGLQWWVFGAAAVFLWWSVLRRAWRESAAPAEPTPREEPAAPRRTT
jgi:surfeit locus 1 family protein